MEISIRGGGVKLVSTFVDIPFVDIVCLSVAVLEIFEGESHYALM